MVTESQATKIFNKSVKLTSASDEPLFFTNLSHYTGVQTYYPQKSFPDMIGLQSLDLLHCFDMADIDKVEHERALEMTLEAVASDRL